MQTSNVPTYFANIDLTLIVLGLVVVILTIIVFWYAYYTLMDELYSDSDMSFS